MRRGGGIIPRGIVDVLKRAEEPVWDDLEQVAGSRPTPYNSRIVHHEHHGSVPQRPVQPVRGLLARAHVVGVGPRHDAPAEYIAGRIEDLHDAVSVRPGACRVHAQLKVPLAQA
jgi:hypothetical protein